MSSTTDPGSRSAAEIEREVEQTRASLTDTLDKLRKRTSPGQLFQQGLDGVVQVRVTPKREIRLSSKLYRFPVLPGNGTF
jgi:hypothetical protein